jgi:hypothetical protein
MFGKSYIMKKGVCFTELTPGSADWKIYWAAFPEQQEAMLSWKRSREVSIRANCERDSIAVIDAHDTVIAFSPADRVHSVWPFLKHRRSHVIVLAPNREEVILIKDGFDSWVCPSKHVFAEESYFSAAENVLRKKLGLEEVLRGRLRDIHYEREPSQANDWEATTVYEYVLQNLTEISSETGLTSIGVREFLQTSNVSAVGALSFRLLNEVVSNGELRWKK